MQRSQGHSETSLPERFSYLICIYVLAWTCNRCKRETTLAGSALPTQDTGTSARSPAADISVETTELAFRVEGVWKGLQLLEDSFHIVGFVSYIPRGPTGL